MNFVRRGWRLKDANVKSNKIASTYDLEIEFANTLEDQISAKQTFSVIDYINRGMEQCIIGDDLYNLLASILKYASASYGYFGGSDAEKAIVDEFAAGHISNVKLPAGVAGKLEFVNVEFVLDEKFEYRVYINADALYEAYLANGGDDTMALDELIKLTTLNISYVAFKGDTVNASTDIKTDGTNYYIDLSIPAYDLKDGVSISFINTTAGVEEAAVYTLADYCADAQNASDELLALVDGMYAYAASANTYVVNKNAQ